MMAKTVRTTPASGDFNTLIFNRIKVAEGAGKYVYNDPKGIPTIGAGVALVVKGVDGVYSRLDNASLTSLFGGVHTWTAAELLKLDNAAKNSMAMLRQAILFPIRSPVPTR